MRVFRWLALAVAALFFVSCEYETVVEEVGYKGRARVNPWLAAERFAEKLGWKTTSETRWSAPGFHEAMWFVPAAVINTEAYVRQLAEWTRNGGHLVILCDRATSYDDWRNPDGTRTEIPEQIGNWLRKQDIEVSSERKERPGEVEFAGGKFRPGGSVLRMVRDMRSPEGVTRAIISHEVGAGRLTVVGDAGIFRNRWISDGENAELFAEILAATPGDGVIRFVRGNAATLWTMVWRHLRAPLIALVVLVLIWLWRNLPRFGPVENSAEVEVLRGYEHHLVALGNFQWRLDRADSLLKPAREKIVELGQRHATQAGRRDDDLFQVLADLAELDREGVRRSLTNRSPADAADLTIITATLQKLLHVLTPLSKA